MNNIEFTRICPVCGVLATDTGNIFKFSSGSNASPDKVFSRVCGYVNEDKRALCINNKGEYDEAEGWLDFNKPKAA